MEIRSNPEVICKKIFLKSLKLHSKAAVSASFCDKTAGLKAVKRDTGIDVCFPVHFAKFLRIPIL